MRFTLSVALIAMGAFCLLQPCQPMPHVVQAGGGSVIVMREVDEVEETVEVGGTASANLLVPEIDDGAESECAEVAEWRIIADITAINEDAPTSTSTVSPRKCTLRGCWRCCQKRGYNWGLCLWKRCHCYY